MLSRSGRPYFSIIVPTRNRSSLLEQALDSVVRQTDQDYELIVSDNCSTDRTAEVAAGAAQHREVKVVRPPQALPMADHWNFALTHAGGEWILLLGDDDYFSRHLLSTLRAAIATSESRVFTWHSAVYHHNVKSASAGIEYVPFYFDPSRINKLDVMSWTGKTYEIDGPSQLAKLYGFQDIVAPSGHVSALRSDLIREVQSWAGTLFHPPYPDFGCSAAVLATAASMAYIDLPLHVLGRVPRLGQFSYLLSTEKKTEFNEALASEYGRQDLYDGQPLRSPTLIITNIAASLDSVRRLMPAPAGAVAYDWQRYFVRCRAELTALGRAGTDVGDLVARYEEALSAQPAVLQKAVRSRLDVRSPALAHQVQRMKTSAVAHRVRRLRDSRRRTPATFAGRADLPRWRSTIDGAEAGFGDIGQASAYMDGLRTEGTCSLATRTR